MKIQSAVFAWAALSILEGCAITQTIRPVAAGRISEICIQENPSVLMKAFPRELRSQIERKGIRTSTYTGDKPLACRHHLEYTANWRWDWAMYLAYADLRVYEDGLLVGQATYDALGGGANYGKFGSTSAKLKPLVDELFARK